MILRLRGVGAVGGTFVNILERYASEIGNQGGKLILCSVHDNVLQQLLHTETPDDIRMGDIFLVTDVLGASTAAALVVATE